LRRDLRWIGRPGVDPIELGPCVLNPLTQRIRRSESIVRRFGPSVSVTSRGVAKRVSGDSRPLYTAAGERRRQLVISAFVLVVDRRVLCVEVVLSVSVIIRRVIPSKGRIDIGFA
jgi:hypothetical protein